MELISQDINSNSTSIVLRPSLAFLWCDRRPFFPVMGNFNHVAFFLSRDSHWSEKIEILEYWNELSLGEVETLVVCVVWSVIPTDCMSMGVNEYAKR